MALKQRSSAAGRLLYLGTLESLGLYKAPSGPFVNRSRTEDEVDLDAASGVPSVLEPVRDAGEVFLDSRRFLTTSLKNLQLRVKDFSEPSIACSASRIC